MVIELRNISKLFFKKIMSLFFFLSKLSQTRFKRKNSIPLLMSRCRKMSDVIFKNHATFLKLKNNN